MPYKKKHLFFFSSIILLACIAYLGSSYNQPKLAQSKVIPVDYQINERNLPQTPFDIIYYYYSALAKLDWETAESLTSPALRAYIRRDDFRSNWERTVAQNEGLEFVMFLVSNQRIDEEKGEAFAVGKVHWRSKTGNIKNHNQTILLTKTPNGWKIKEFRSFTSVQTVEDFYQAISNQDWTSLEDLTTPKYWRKLKAAGVIDSLIKERGQFEKEVYVFFLVDEFWEGKKTAFVSGDVTWKPLSEEFAENVVTIRLLNREGKWKVDNIRGHWNLKK